jgi:hypothetical protein
MKCLVTGCAGFMGSHLCDRLTAEGRAGVGIDAFTDYYAPSLKEANLAALRGRPGLRLVRANLPDLHLGPLLDDVDVPVRRSASERRLRRRNARPSGRDGLGLRHCSDGLRPLGRRSLLGGGFGRGR